MVCSTFLGVRTTLIATICCNLILAGAYRDITWIVVGSTHMICCEMNLRYLEAKKQKIEIKMEHCFEEPVESLCFLMDLVANGHASVLKAYHVSVFKDLVMMFLPCTNHLLVFSFSSFTILKKNNTSNTRVCSVSIFGPYVRVI